MQIKTAADFAIEKALSLHPFFFGIDPELDRRTRKGREFYKAIDFVKNTKEWEMFLQAQRVAAIEI